MQYLLSFMVVQKVFQRLDQVLQENSKKITGLDIPYYATIDFGGFKGIVDSLGGIEVDVPYALHDLQYPDDHLRGFDPLHVEA